MSLNNRNKWVEEYLDQFDDLILQFHSLPTNSGRKAALKDAIYFLRGIIYDTESIQKAPKDQEN